MVIAQDFFLRAAGLNRTFSNCIELFHLTGGFKGKINRFTLKTAQKTSKFLWCIQRHHTDLGIISEGMLSFHRFPFCLFTLKTDIS